MKKITDLINDYVEERPRLKHWLSVFMLSLILIPFFLGFLVLVMEDPRWLLLLL